MFVTHFHTNKTSEIIAFYGTDRGDLKKVHRGFYDVGMPFRRRQHKCHLRLRLPFIQEPPEELKGVRSMTDLFDYNMFCCMGNSSVLFCLLKGHPLEITGDGYIRPGGDWRKNRTGRRDNVFTILN